MSRRRIGRRPRPTDAPPPDPSAHETAYWEAAERAEPLTEAELDALTHLYEDGGAALARWKDRLSEYVDQQGTLDVLRLRPSSEQPWPAFDNPMLGYLKERTSEIVDRDGIEAAVTWLAANAWFEGAIAERARFHRLLDTD